MITTSQYSASGSHTPAHHLSATVAQGTGFLCMQALNIHYLIGQMLCLPNTWAFMHADLHSGSAHEWETYWQQAA